MTGWWEIPTFRVSFAIAGEVTVGLAVALVALAAGRRASLSWTVIVFAPLGLGLLLVALFFLVLRPWRIVADIAAMRAGRALMHWTYDASAWRAANRYDERRYVFWLRGSLIALAVGGLLLVIGIIGGERAIGASAFGGVLTFTAVAALIFLVLGSPVRAARRAGRGEIYVSRDGIYRQPGGYTSFDLGANVKYDVIELVDRPTPHIHIEWNMYGRGRGILTDVGVPPGHEDEARTVVERLRAELGRYRW